MGGSNCLFSALTQEKIAEIHKKTVETHAAIFGGEGQIQFQLSRYYELFYGIKNLISALETPGFGENVSRDTMVDKLKELIKE